MYAEGKLSACDVCNAAGLTQPHASQLDVQGFILPPHRQSHLSNGRAAELLARETGWTAFLRAGRMYYEKVAFYDKVTGKNAGAPTLSACRTTRWLLLLPLAGPSNSSLRTKIFYSCRR
jgi:hypothetical protein